METIVQINENGKPLYTDTDKQAMREVFKRCKGEHIKLKVTGYKGKRSNAQNAYYRAVVLPIITNYFNQEKTFDIPVSYEQVHEILKENFLGFEEKEIGGKICKVVRSTTDLERTGNEKGFFDAFVNPVVKWACEYLNLIIPPPPIRKSL